MRPWSVKIITLFLTSILFACQKQSASPAKTDTSSVDDSCLVAVDATVYRGLMNMLGIGNRCIDLSDYMKIDVEQLVSSGAKIFMVSMYDGLDIEKYQRTGIKVIECTDFTESSALARAKWMVRYGELLGVKERADSLYRVVVERYDSLCVVAQKKTTHPMVMFDLMYGNLWYQPTKESSTGGIIADAGGRLLFPTGGKNGIMALTKEQMLIHSNEPDVWIIRYSATETMTSHTLESLNIAYKQFKAFQEGNVWACNTLQTAYFDEAPFRPDYLLEDVLNILYPTQDTIFSLRYFEKVR